MEIRKGSSSSYRSLISPGLMSNIPPEHRHSRTERRFQRSSVGNRRDVPTCLRLSGCGAVRHQSPGGSLPEAGLSERMRPGARLCLHTCPCILIAIGVVRFEKTSFFPPYPPINDLGHHHPPPRPTPQKGT